MADETKTPKPPKRGVGTVIREKLRAGSTNQEALDTVKAEFPASNTTLQTVAWYRTDLRAKGEKVPSARELAAKVKEAAAASAGGDPLDS